MSRAIKRKHVLKELFEDDYSLPKPNQQIVRVLGNRGNYLLEVETVDGSKFLISMPTKFRNSFWVKRGDYVLIEPIEEGNKVKGELVRILTHEHIKYYKKDKVWPSEFDSNVNNKSNESSEDEYDNYKLTANMNRLQFHGGGSGEDSGSEDDSKDEKDGEDKEDSQNEDDTETNDETTSDKKPIELLFMF